MKKIISLFISLFLIMCLFIKPLNANASFEINFESTCQTLFLADLDTGTILYEKYFDEEGNEVDENYRRFPASITKIMTFIVARENIPNPENVQITAPDYIFNQLADSSISGIKLGETLTAKDLLYALMVPSGNDAALVLADYVGDGEIQNFVDLMNKKAEELECENTHFMNPHGLHDAEHYTTARDLYKITSYALRDELFKEVSSTARYALPETNIQPKRTLSTTNMLITQAQPAGFNYYYQYAKGIKTGTTTEAGYCIISTAFKNKSNYLCIAMGSPSRDKDGNKIPENGAFVDSKKLYEWAFNELRIQQILSVDNSIGQTNVNFAFQTDVLKLVPEQNLSATLPKGIDPSSVKITLNVPKSVDAPIEKGQVIGTVSLEYAGEDLGTVNVVAQETIRRNSLVHFWDNVQKFLSSAEFIIGLSIVIILIVIYIIITVTKNNNRKKRQITKRLNRI